MTDITLDQRPARRFDFSRVRDLFFHPGRVFQAMTSESRATWLTPMLLLTVTSILIVIVAGYLKARAAMMGEIQLPRDWQFWSPDMQNNYMQAQQATQGPGFMYVSTLLGGRGSMQGALNIVAWASLPFAVRDILRIIFMLSAGHAINSPGLSGFASTAGFLSQLLTRVDIFLIWQVILLIIGFGIADSLPRSKAVAGVVVIMLLVLLAQAGLGALTSGLGGTAVQRPFF
jgi:hypothetical protein